MKKFYFTIFCLIAFPIWGNAEETNICSPEVQKFIADEITCLHFAGEITGHPDERGREVNQALKKYCHSDEERNKLLAKYQNNGDVTQILLYFKEQRGR